MLPFLKGEHSDETKPNNHLIRFIESFLAKENLYPWMTLIKVKKMKSYVDDVEIKTDHQTYHFFLQRQPHLL